MKTITKHFNTLKQAERYQDKLYEQYSYVRLIRCPLFEETGVYAWDVKL